MKVALISYPMLFQGTGGLQVQILETLSALKRIGVDARLIDPVHEKLLDFDLIHVFSAINGNYRIVQRARSLGLPVVISPLIRTFWNRKSGIIARLLDSSVSRFSRWTMHTDYKDVAFALRQSNAIIALGPAEKRAISEAFLADASSIRVIPNGISSRFFESDGGAFCSEYSITPGFILNVATVDDHKNQLAAARALEGTGYELVIIGPLGENGAEYLDSLRGFSHVRYLGPIQYDDPLLPSAYAAAGVFCLPSKSEVMPLSAMEALAAGTPIVITRHHSMDLGDAARFSTEIEPTETVRLRDALLRAANSRISREEVGGAMRRFTWDAVGEQVFACYRDVIAGS